MEEIHRCSRKKNEVSSHRSQSKPLSFEFFRFAPKFVVVCISHRKLNKIGSFVVGFLLIYIFSCVLGTGALLASGMTVVHCTRRRL